MVKKKVTKPTIKPARLKKTAKKAGRKPVVRKTPPRKKTAAGSRPMPLSAATAPNQIIALFEAFLDEQGDAAKPRTAAQLKSLDDKTFQELVESTDWRQNDGPELTKAFLDSARAELTPAECKDAAEFAKQLPLSREQTARRLIGGYQVPLTPKYRKILERLLVQIRWESVLCWVIFCCGCCRCWPIWRDWPFCRMCCRCGWIHVTQNGVNLRHARWLDFTGGVAVTYGPQSGRSNIDIHAVGGGGVTQADIDNAIAQHSAANRPDHDGRYYEEGEVDALLNTHKASGDHDARYYTRTQVDNTFATQVSVTNAFAAHVGANCTDHDNRYYTETEIDNKLAAHVGSGDHDGRYAPRTFDRAKCAGYLPGLMNDPGDACRVISGQKQDPTNWTVSQGAPNPSAGYLKIPLVVNLSNFTIKGQEFIITGYWDSAANAKPIRIKNPAFVTDAGTLNGWFLTCYIEDLNGVPYNQGSGQWAAAPLTITFEVFLFTW
jgi:hypothetical protein